MLWAKSLALHHDMIVLSCRSSKLEGDDATVIYFHKVAAEPYCCTDAELQFTCESRCAGHCED